MNEWKSKLRLTSEWAEAKITHTKKEKEEKISQNIERLVSMNINCKGPISVFMRHFQVIWRECSDATEYLEPLEQTAQGRAHASIDNHVKCTYFQWTLHHFVILRQTREMWVHFLLVFNLVVFNHSLYQILVFVYWTVNTISLPEALLFL